MKARQSFLLRLRRSSAPCALLAVVVAIQFLGALILAANDKWHCECCPDAGTDRDQCIVTLLLSGSVTSATLPLPTFKSVEWVALPWRIPAEDAEVSWLSAFSVMEHAPPVLS